MMDSRTTNLINQQLIDGEPVNNLMMKKDLLGATLPPLCGDDPGGEGVDGEVGEMEQGVVRPDVKP